MTLTDRERRLFDALKALLPHVYDPGPIGRGPTYPHWKTAKDLIQEIEDTP